MKTIIMQVNYKKYNISMEDSAYFAFNHMKDVNNLKKRCRYAILNNEYDREYKNGDKYLCSYSYISSYLENNLGITEFVLHRIDNNNFRVDGIEN